MEWINKIAFYQNIRNEIPNQQLASELAKSANVDGIKEISGFLFDKNNSIASDCIKVLYEIGYINPELIQDYVNTFIQLLENKNNRMVWGGMIALSTISSLKADDIFKKIDLVLQTIKNGTVITEVAGIRILVKVLSKKKAYREKLLPVLFDYLEKCRPVDFATRVETIMPEIKSEEEKEIFNNIIEIKKEDLTDAQLKKLKTILNRYNRKR